MGSVVDALDKQMRGGKYRTIKKVTQPTELTAISAKFRFGKHEGLKLTPGDQVLIEIPDLLRARPARFAILGHNQNPTEVHKTKLAKDERDPTPGLTAMHFHDPSRPGKRSVEDLERTLELERLRRGQVRRDPSRHRRRGLLRPARERPFSCRPRLVWQRPRSVQG